MATLGKGRLAILAAAGMYFLGMAVAYPASAHREYHTGHIVHRVSRAAPRVITASYGPTSPGISSIVIDVGNGEVISSHDADTPRYPASLTKLMTLDLAFQALSSGRMTLDTRIPVSEHAASVEPVKLGLRPGSTISVRSAILAMTTMSANDAATALGEYLGGGSEARCAQMMTLRAHALGMAQTEFTNASGLPNPNQVTTARDIALLARDLVLRYPQYQSFFEVTSFDFRGRKIFSNNQMLKSYFGATGMKTGYTDLARHNLVTSADRGDKRLIGVVLHEPSWGTAYSQMTAMLDGGFGGHVPMTEQMVAEASHPAGQRLIPLFRRTETVASRTPVHARELPNSAARQPNAERRWVAQLGLYRYKFDARVAALHARRLRGNGVAQIEHIERHGKNLWLAQLTGLTYLGAHDACRAINVHGHQCDVRPLHADHLAMLNQLDGT
ncbi:D-alanyl-D-alanine carboxypeptidase family protein [Acidocella sp.]|uniref:D-alanyl-D-alanine carboxypeptidase family protein n=1 Tax=Acidocella sp. TaxID=50710 RepID=UPI00262A84C8|nr:D-alanyl-D-alanine carboxypeptidase family protein [Acidocella sp.]